MSHVDEGMLHAYLDGALEEYPSSEARRVRDHLDGCAVCRERLAVERRIRDEAASILELAAPRVTVPTLEELRAHAEADATRRGPVRGRPWWLGWAASLILALGTGWVLRGGGERGATVELVEPAVRREAAAPTGGPAEGARIEVPVAPPATPPVVAIAIDTPSTDVLSDDALTETLAAADLVPPALPEPEAIVVTSSNGQPGGAVEVRRDTSSARRPAPGELVTSASASAPAIGLSRGRGSSDGRDAVPSADDTYSLVVPGPRVLGVRFRGSGTQPEGQVALQLLESGDTLQVIHLPPDLDPSSVEPRAAGTNELVVKRAAGWIIMRAPLEDAQLMELMTRLLSGS